MDQHMEDISKNRDAAVSREKRIANLGVDQIEWDLSKNAYERTMVEKLKGAVGWRSKVFFNGAHSKCKNCRALIMLHQAKIDRVLGRLAHHLKHQCKCKEDVNLEELTPPERDKCEKKDN